MKVSQAVLDNLARARSIRSANAQAKKAGSAPPPVPTKLVPSKATAPKGKAMSTVYGHCTVKSCGRAFTYQVEVGGQLFTACPACRGKAKKAA